MESNNHLNHNNGTTSKREHQYSNNSNKNNNMDSFLASMTFAGTGPGMVRGGCDCDECEGGGGGGFATPQTIIEAIRKHKKQKVATRPMKRTQQRKLIKREPFSQISIYQLTIPQGWDNEPLIEFGTSHRLVWIQQLPSTTSSSSCNGNYLWSIGKGIVGSQDEERSRQKLTQWKQGDIYLVPSNGGKAVAWIHSSSNNQSNSNNTDSGKEGEKNPEAKQEDENNNKEEEKKEPSNEEEGEEKKETSNGGHAVLYICKIPKDSLTSATATTKTNTNREEEIMSPPEWQDVIRQTCKEAFDNFVNENTTTTTTTTVQQNDENKDNSNNNNNNEGGMQYQRLSDDSASRLLREVLMPCL